MFEYKNIFTICRVIMLISVILLSLFACGTSVHLIRLLIQKHHNYMGTKNEGTPPASLFIKGNGESQKWHCLPFESELFMFRC